MFTHCLHCRAWDPAPDLSEGHCRRLAPIFLQGELLDPEDRAAEARRERQRTGLDVIYLDRAVWPRTAADDGCCDGFPKDPDECQPLPDRVTVPKAETPEEALERIKQEDNRGEQWKHAPKPPSKRMGRRPADGKRAVYEKIAGILSDGPRTSAELASILKLPQSRIASAISQNRQLFQKAVGHNWKLADTK
jgi:hypothetical protein